MSAAKVVELRPGLELGARVGAKRRVQYLSGYVARRGAVGQVAMMLYGGSVVGVRWDNDSSGILRATPLHCLEVLL